MSVKSFKLPTKKEGKCCKIKKCNEYKLLTDLRDQVNATKSTIDEPYAKNPRRMQLMLAQSHLSTGLKHQIHQKYNTPNVSNAWLKAYELFHYFHVFPTISEQFTYFDNAAFPGSFILAAHHHITTLCDIKKFRWIGSSWINTKTSIYEKQLDDTYKLYENYRDNWAMTDKMNGDVMDIKNQEYFYEKYGNSVDAYTSDLGVDVSDDYNNQELKHVHAHLGQILTALLVLKKNGKMIVKQYSYFEPATIAIIYAIRPLFKQLEICKPIFSKPTNSETYLVGLGYKGLKENPFNKPKGKVGKIIEKLRNWNDNPISESVDEGFIEALYVSQKHFADIEILRIKEAVRLFYMSGNKPFSKLFADENKKDMEKWAAVPMKKMEHGKKLIVDEVISKGKSGQIGGTLVT